MTYGLRRFRVMNDAMTAIVILNWNRAVDTIACLESLYCEETDFFLTLADNNSDTDNFNFVVCWLKEHNIVHRVIDRGTVLDAPPKARECVVVRMDVNLGFAAGNNAALECLGGFVPKYVMLLNNDTLVTAGFLRTLTEYMDVNDKYMAVTPRIHYNEPRDMIWNCGGRLLPGARKYHYARCLSSAICEHNHIDITFVTGCALLVRRELLDERNHLLTERFFFGEEDFEFSLRMKRAGHKMACVLDSVIYHKVSASMAHVKTVARLQLHYVNRTVDIRLHYNRAFFYLWLVAQTFYVVALMVRRGYRLHDIRGIVRAMWHDGRALDGVSADYVRNILG